MTETHTGQRGPWRASAVVAAILWTNSAWAQPADVIESLEPDEHGEEARPWIDRSVPLATREAARAHFLEGTALIRNGFFPEAEKHYLDALALLEHPGIHYNLAIAQMNQRKPILAYKSFEKAMKFGAGPLGVQRLQRAREYRELLASQLTVVEIVCELEGAEVALDGKVVFVGPGTYRGIVKAGEYQIVAKKPPLVPDTKRVVLEGGTTARFELTPRPLPPGPEPVRHWASWKPWAVVGAGTAFVLVGGAFHVRATRNFDAFDREFDAVCPDGCLDTGLSSALDRRLSRARWQKRGAIASYAAGGLTLAVGFVLAYHNRVRLIHRESRERSSGALFTPFVGTAGGAADSTSMGLTIRFEF